MTLSARALALDRITRRFVRDLTTALPLRGGLTARARVVDDGIIACRDSDVWNGATPPRRQCEEEAQREHQEFGCTLEHHL